jgi:hypothetical protein
LIGHKRHVAANVAPVLVEYVPAPQSVHAALPVLILYLPATQAEQTPPFGPVNPALQVQSPAVELAMYEFEFEGHVIHVVEIVAPVLVEYVPVPQSVHAVLPVLILYLPATQAEQTPPFGPVNPVLHVQAVAAVLGLGELELPGHATQFDSSVAPCVPKYLPAPQSVHAALPVLILYLPATQAEQTPPFGPVNPVLHVQAAMTVLELGE